MPPLEGPIMGHRVVRRGGVVAVAAILTSVLVLGLAYELDGPGVTIAYAAAALFVFTGLYMWHTSQIHFLLILPFYFDHFTAIISNVYIEQGTYITEQYRFSLATGSTLRLTIYAGLFLGAMFITIRRLAPTAKLRALVATAQTHGHVRLLSNTIIAVALLWLLLLLVSGVMFGFPVFLGQDRFSYWSSHPVPYVWRVLIQGIQLSFLLGIAYGMSDKGPLRRTILLVFALMLCTNVLFGDKFSSSAFALMNFGAAAAVMRQLVSGVPLRLSRLVPRLIIACAFFFYLVSWSYREISSIASQDVVDYIVSRALGLQGHTWWGIDFLARQGETNGVQIGHLFQRHSPETPGGIYLLMYALAPPQAVASYMTKGISFTMGGTAIAVYTLGYLLAIPYLLLAGAVTGAALSYLASKAASVQLWRAWIALKVTWIALLAFDAGDVYLILSLSMGLYLLIVVADLLRQSFGSRLLHSTS